MPKFGGVYVLIEIPADLHYQAKIRAARERITLKEFSIQALHQAVAKPWPEAAVVQALAAKG